MGDDGLIRRAEQAAEHQANAEARDSEAVDELLYQAGVATGEIISNPYDPDGWAYAWVCDNGTWGEKLETGATIEEGEGIIVAKFYETGNKITPPEFVDGDTTYTLLEGNEYVMVLEGNGTMGNLMGDDGTFGAWIPEIMLFIDGQSNQYTLAYVSEIIVCDGVTNIGDMAFMYAVSLKKVTINDNVTAISNFAFTNCMSLTEVTIPNSVTSIGNNAFLYCESLTSITIPNNITSIGDSAFCDCDNLTSVTIGNSVTSIGEHAFYGCDNLTSITIGKSVTSIGEYAFYGCDSLTTVTIDSKEIASLTTSIGSNEELVRNATTIYINEGIEEANIGSYIISNFDKAAKSDKTGYVKYTKK